MVLSPPYTRMPALVAEDVRVGHGLRLVVHRHDVGASEQDEGGLPFELALVRDHPRRRTMADEPPAQGDPVWIEAPGRCGGTRGDPGPVMGVAGIVHPGGAGVSESVFRRSFSWSAYVGETVIRERWPGDSCQPGYSCARSLRDPVLRGLGRLPSGRRLTRRPALASRALAGRRSDQQVPGFPLGTCFRFRPWLSSWSGPFSRQQSWAFDRIGMPAGSGPGHRRALC